MAKLVPADDRPRSVWGALKGAAMVVGDIETVIGPTGERWDADE